VTALHYVVGAERFEIEAGGDGELTLTVAPDDFARLRDGSLDPVVAYMQGRLKIAGDMSALYALLPSIPLPDES
jgi:putative sterol carrier protein